MRLTFILLLISFSCRAQDVIHDHTHGGGVITTMPLLRPNYKDSANKYWKIAIAFADSVAEHKRLGNKTIEAYFYRKEREARVKSAKYVEKF